ncbi:16S rRNA (cytosine(967)-C(5))-methyltransferase RsmB [Desulfonema magnum]|uniref:16S rRNA (cytosine(967)-C(5))-methyltransferase n=1 Tax=Desulfonema magnum TaxID=45655 RepID=A0A975GTZ1_9BACT|nr:16S rRNA (cytosine(967)-C(5))-methyltransferase RsmB [Desulfonema magnum]QTA93507.1 putative ribosomal RNA small subunit methyltransferase B [Desulfonema magnum]
MANNARQTALFILNTLDKKRTPLLDNILEDVLDQDSPLSRRDRSLLYALVYGVLRWRGSLDWIIGYFSKTRLNKIDHRVLNVLRIGLFQMIYLDRIPVSAAVNTSVEMTKSFAAPWVVRFVNALLRNAARRYKTVPFPNIDKNPVAALAAAKSFPKWLIERWLARLGIEETGKLCDAINTIPPITIRTNTLRSNREQLINALESDVEKMKPTPYAPDGLSFFNPKILISEMDTFKNGWFQVQDEAAQLVTCLLNPRAGDTVLDACAGLGGKTGHIAQMMQNQGHIVSLDCEKKKLLRLRNETERLGISIVETCVHDLYEPFEKKKPSFFKIPGFCGFDRILLDAPCSGLGVLRRNPDTKWSVSKKNLKRYKQKQIKFLNNVAPLVKPGGILVYAVCSTEPEENEAVAEAFLNQHPEFETGKRKTENGKRKTFPHLDNMDGFFSIRFKRVPDQTDFDR